MTKKHSKLPMFIMGKDKEKMDRVSLSAPEPPNPPRSLEDGAEERFQPKSFKFWSVIISIFLALFLVALDRTIIGTATPAITADFHSPGDIGWYGSAYQLTTAASQLLFGRVYKFYDIKITFLVTLLLFEVGSVICGAAPSSVVFIIGRAIAGVGGAGLFSGVTIIMITQVPLRKRPMFQGLFGTIFGLASVVGPLVGGALTDAATWRWCFYINLPIGAVAAVCIIFILKSTKVTRPKATLWQHIWRLDPLGTFLFVPSIVTLLIALQWGGSKYAWSNWRIILLFVLFGVLFIAFGVVQAYTPKTATVPARIICRRSIFAATVFMFALAGSFLMAIYYLPIWFQVVKGVSATQSGVDTLPFVIALVVGSILSGIFTQKVGYYVPAMIASPSLLAIGQGLMSTFKVDSSPSYWIGYQVIAGFGLGLGLQAASLAAQAVLPAPDVSIGIAIMFFAQQLGGGIFTSVGQNLLSTYLVSNLHVPGVTVDQITSEGATDLVNSVAPEYKLTVRTVYNQALSRIFLTAMGVALVAVVAGICMEWKNVKKLGPHGGPPPAKAAGPGERPDSPNPPVSEQSSGPFMSLSPKVSSEIHSNYDRGYDRDEMNGAMRNTNEIHAAPQPKAGCEHCEHCRLSRALTIVPPERHSPQLTAPASNSRSQHPTYPATTSTSQALEEAARLAAVARETVAKLEELTRPFSLQQQQQQQQNAPTLPQQAYVPYRPGRPSFNEPEIPPRKPRREPTTEELVENARRVSAQLEHESRGDRRRETNEDTWGSRSSDQYYR